MATIPMMVQPPQFQQQDFAKTYLTIAQLRQAQEHAAHLGLQNQMLQAELNEIPIRQGIMQGQVPSGRATLPVPGGGQGGPSPAMPGAVPNVPVGPEQLPREPTGELQGYQDLRTSSLPQPTPGATTPVTPIPWAPVAPGLPAPGPRPQGVPPAQPPDAGAPLQAPLQGPGSPTPAQSPLPSPDAGVPSTPPTPGSPAPGPMAPQGQGQAPPEPPTLREKMEGHLDKVYQLLTKTPITGPKYALPLLTGLEHEINVNKLLFEQKKSGLEALKQGAAAVIDTPVAQRPAAYAELRNVIIEEMPELGRTLPPDYSPQAEERIAGLARLAQTQQERIAQAQKSYDDDTKRYAQIIEARKADIEEAKLSKLHPVEGVGGRIGMVPEYSRPGVGANAKPSAAPGTVTLHIDPTTGKPFVGQKAAEETDKLATRLDRVEQPYKILSDTYGKFIAAANENTVPGDASLRTLFAKILTPTEAVMEGDYGRTQTGTMMEQFKGAWNQFIAGEEPLQPKQKQELVSAATALHTQATADHDRIVEDIKRLAVERNLNPADVSLNLTTSAAPGGARSRVLTTSDVKMLEDAGYSHDQIVSRATAKQWTLPKGY